ncbi:hypothetical protein BG004_002846, partial [Podila humilis]
MTTKGASVISVPSSRGHAEVVEDDEDDEGEEISEGAAGTFGVRGSGASARKRAKGKHTSSNSNNVHARHRQTQLEDGVLDLDDEDIMPDYSDTPMYEFVNDMGIGRRSQLFLDQQKQLLEKRRLAKLEKQAKKDIVDGEGRAGSTVPQHGEGNEGEEGIGHPDDLKGGHTLDGALEKKEDVKKVALTSKMMPQAKTIELDIESLTVDHAAVDGIEQGPIEYVEESASTRFINSASFSNKFRSEKWTDEETEMFYQ